VNVSPVQILNRRCPGRIVLTEALGAPIIPWYRKGVFCRKLY
jgi:hypothetical protein